ncbi:MAG: hypothetical protein NVS1B2_23810 [Vulcanimicrobiaceae bacterium]
MRFVVGPVGVGKTTALVSYLASRASPAAYLALGGDEAPDSFRVRLAAVVGIAYVPASADAFVAALATIAPCEIVLDDVDRAPAETIDEIDDLVRDAPAGIAFVLASRSRSGIEAARFVARGCGAILETSALAFDAGDVARICDLHRVAYTTTEIARFLEETEGWPLVASWALRETAGDGCALAGSVDRWRRKNARHFRDFIDDELRQAGEAYRDAFRGALAGTGWPQERERLELLEARGLFVTFVDGAFRPFRVARQLEAGPVAGAPVARDAALLVVRMFGRFEASIGNRKIEWIRKREAQIFKYLVLKRQGTASRDELLAAFWPGASVHASTQSLRTASSNIRKALAAIVGYAEVERYFTSRGELAVALDRAVIDVRRFSAHVADGDVERERGHLAEAFAHYRAAESIYRGELLCGEAPEPWYAARAAMYDALYASVLERIADYHRDAGHDDRAREYGALVADLRARTDR